MAKAETKQDKAASTDVDRYPTVNELVSRVQAEGEIPNVQVDRVELAALASGEVTYRWWTPRADEPEGGYLPPPA